MTDTENDVVRSSETKLIDEDGETYIREDASAHAGFLVFAVGGGLGAGVGLFLGEVFLCAV